MASFTPNQENKTKDTAEKEVYEYCDHSGSPIQTTKEIFKTEDKIIFYPYSVRASDGLVLTKKVKKITLLGWKSISDIPADFKTTGRYGFGTARMKQFFSIIYSKMKELENLTVGINSNNRFSKKSISMNWGDLENVLKKIGKEKRWYDSIRIHLVNNELSLITSKFQYKNRNLSAGQLDSFLKKFDSFEKVNKNDLESLSNVLNTIPPSKISSTSNFIKTKDKINRVFLEEVIKKFEKLMSAKIDNEKDWQTFFGDHSWILSHLFPFEVILKEREAYVGGKTISNDDGRIVDFLFENGFQDNFALLEIKTHKKELLKAKPYRKPDAFAYSDDLSGGISQCLDQKDIFIREFGQKTRVIDPRVLLIIGMKKELDLSQAKCFELLRSNQKNVEIITFDELFAKLKGLLRVISQ